MLNQPITDKYYKHLIFDNGQVNYENFIPVYSFITKIFDGLVHEYAVNTQWNFIRFGKVISEFTLDAGRLSYYERNKDLALSVLNFIDKQILIKKLEQLVE